MIRETRPIPPRRIAASCAAGLGLLFAACATTPPTPAPSHFVLFGQPAHPTPLSETGAERLALYADVEAFLAIDDPDAELSAITAFATALVTEATALLERLEALGATGDPEDVLLVRIASAAVLEHAAHRIAGLPAPPDVAADEAMAKAYREALVGRAGTLAVRARTLYRACAEAAEAAGTFTAAPWITACKDRAEALAPLADRADSPLAGAFPDTPLPAVDGPLPGPVPDGCGKRTHPFSFQAPQAPPPVLTHPPVVAIVTGRLPLEGDDVETLLARVTDAVAAHTDLPLLSRETVRHAEARVAARRWRDDGPVCGQAPPLPAVLARDHPHLVLARVRRMDLARPPDAPRDEASDVKLEVHFSRPGLVDPPDDLDPLPAPLGAPVRDPDDPASWIEAAGKLGPGGTAYLMGAIGGRGTAYLHVAEADGTDPFLRIGLTLSGALREAITGCYREAGVVGFDVAWEVSESGAAGDVSVTRVAGPTGPGDAADLEAAAEAAGACIAEVVAGAGWPCPRAEAPVRVSARVCTGHAPTGR